MKKILLGIALAAAFSTNAFAQHSFTAKFTDLTNDTVKFVIYNKVGDEKEIEQDLIAKDGVITYDFNGDKARFGYIYPEGPQGNNIIYLYLVPGEEGVLTGTVEDNKWSGTKFYTELAAFNKTVDTLVKERDAYISELSAEIEAGANVDSLMAAIGKKMDPIDQQLIAAYTDYVNANPGSMVSATLVTMLPDKLKMLETLTPELRGGVFSDVIFGIIIQDAKEKARKKREEGLSPGILAPDFTLNDINGNPLSLSSLRGKYVILDFWGSWCFWCIKGMPKMKEYYDKYKDRLEILGIDCNDTEDKWKASVEKNQIPWKHVYNPKDSELLKTYAIQGFPTKILIDPEGKIVRFVAGEREEFYTTLDEVLGK